MEVCEADLGEELFPAGRGGGKNDSFVLQGGYKWELQREGGAEGWRFGLGGNFVGGRGLSWGNGVFGIRHARGRVSIERMDVKWMLSLSLQSSIDDEDG